MELPALHTHITCPRDGGVAILQVDVETRDAFPTSTRMATRCTTA